MVPGYLGRILDADGSPLGTCFQVRPGVLVTAWHVLVEAGAENLGAQVQVDGLPPDGVGPEHAEVLQIDPLHDLAVLRRAVPLPVSVGSVAATDQLSMDVVVDVTGHAVVDDPDVARPRYLNASGLWAGGTTRDDGIAVGRMQSGDTMKGMSGAPVRRRSDDAVVGVVSARYNSVDGWLRDSVWIVRTEDLLPLLRQVEETEQLGLTGMPALSGAADLLLRVDETTVRLHVDGRVVEAEHAGVSVGLAGALNDVRRARARAGTQRSQPDAAPTVGAGAVESMRRAGRLLGDSFLPEPIGKALAEVIAAGEASTMPIRLGIAVDPAVVSWSTLPWEALLVPGTNVPLALHRLITVYRAASTAVPVRKLAGPLRIVVAIAAPERGGSGVLDYEQELRTVLAAVRSARAGAGMAQVQVVPFATTAAIAAALAGGNVHVLHVSGHGGPGVLELEDDDGDVREITAAEFLEEAIPAEGMPPVISLSACYTSVPPGAKPGDVAATSFAQDLMAHGASAVIATETSVTDAYATRLFARVYAELATAPAPDLVAAVGKARRIVQRELAGSSNLRSQQLAGLDEWGVITVLAAAPQVLILDTNQTSSIQPSIDGSRRTIAGLLARNPGEFVGRRREQRQLPTILTGDSLNGRQYHGVVLRGIGGIGKTTLAAEIIRRTLEADPGRLIATVTGPTGIETLFSTVVQTLRLPLLSISAAGSLLQRLDLVARSDLGTADRFMALREVLDVIPLLLVLDNFEDNLSPVGTDGLRTIRDDSLAALLAAWASQPGASRMLITCRYPFSLPDSAELNLLDRPLGPLTAAETMKLAWALPRLDALDDDDLEKVWRVVGGHPRTLEYLDALLAGGQGRFPDITTRLHLKVQTALGAEARRWLASQRTLDAALADAVTVAADDILLPDLLTEIANTPNAEQALLGLSVYREPVDLNALLFQIGQVDETAAWTPDRAGAQQRILAILAAHDIDVAEFQKALAAGNLPASVASAVSADLEEFSATPRPPRTAPGNLDQLLEAVTASTLLTVDLATGSLFVHRWTADELTRRWIADGRGPALGAAYRNAAAYWRWRVDVWLQDRHADVHDLLEARHHHLAVGDIDDAAKVTEWACSQLDVWGAWDQETALIHDTLNRLPAGHIRRPAWLHQLGLLAYKRGDFAEAQRRYEQCLEIDERLGQQSGMSKTYHQLGMLAQDRGDYAEAQRRYEQSLEIKERLDDQSGMSKSYHQLGLLAHLRLDYSEAQRRYEQSMEISERLGDQSGMSRSYHQLGMLAEDRDDYAEAQRRYEQSLEIDERLGDQPGMAISYHQLGILAQYLGDYAEAQRRYEQSLEIKERLGDQFGLSKAYHQLGRLAYLQGDLSEAEHRYVQSIAINERLGDPIERARTQTQLASVKQAQGQHSEAIALSISALIVTMSKGLGDQFDNIAKLRQIRKQIGEQAFNTEVSELLDADSLNTLLDLINNPDKPPDAS